MVDKELKILIDKYYEGETSLEEEEQIYSALSDRKNIKGFESEWALFQLMEQNRKEELSSDFDIELAKKISALPGKSRVRKLNRFSLIGVAASLLLLSFYLVFDQGWLSSQQQISTTDEITKIELTDGSVVWLNKDSELKYPKHFDGEYRQVSLKGEGFFEVTANAEWPFSVQTDNTQIKVLGTSFNVNDNQDDGTVEVAVNSGKVSFSSKSNGVEEIIYLGRNEIGIYSKREHSMVKRSNDNGNNPAWKSMNSELSGTQILIKAFEKLEDNYSIEPYVLTGFFREILSENGKAVLLTEAMVDIWDHGFSLIEESTGLPEEDVFLPEVRKSLDYSRNEIKNNLEQFNSLAGILKWNRVKYLDPQLSERLEANEYMLDGIDDLKGNSVYVIRYSQDIENLIYHDTYYIDTQSFAFMKYEKRSLAKQGYYLNNQFSLAGDSTYLFRLKEDNTYYEFKDNNEKLYLNQAGGDGLADIVNAKTGEVEWVLGIKRMLAIDRIEHKDVPQGMVLMESEKSLGLQITPYNSGFWNNYDLMNLFPLNDKQKSDLEWELPLEIQFEGLTEVREQ